MVGVSVEKLGLFVVGFDDGGNVDAMLGFKVGFHDGRREGYIVGTAAKLQVTPDAERSVVAKLGITRSKSDRAMKSLKTHLRSGRGSEHDLARRTP